MDKNGKPSFSLRLLSAGFHASLYQYFTTAMASLFNFLSLIYVLRKLEVGEFGFYNFLLSAVFLIQTVSFAGTDSIIQRYLPEYEETGNNYLKKRILGFCMLLCLLAVSVILAAVFLAREKIAALFNLPGYSTGLFGVLAAITVLSAESYLLGDIALVSMFKNRYWSLCSISYSFIKLASFYLAFRLGCGIRGILFGWLAAEVLLFALLIGKACRDIFSLPVKKEDIVKLPLKRFFDFAKFLYFHKLTQFFRRKGLDIFLLSYFLGPGAVGIYSVSFGIPLLLLQISPANKLHPILKTISIRNYTKERNTENFFHLFSFLNRITFFLMMPLFVFAMVLADKIILFLLNPGYASSADLFRLSLAFIAVHQFGFVYTPLLFTLERTKIIFVTGLISLLNLVLDLILIPVYGVPGAIAATGITGIIIILYFRYATGRIIPLAYPWRSFAVFSINILLTALPLFFLRPLIKNIFSLTWASLTAVSLYLVLSFFNKGFETEDRDTINRTIGRKIWVF